MLQNFRGMICFDQIGNPKTLSQMKMGTKGRLNCKLLVMLSTRLHLNTVMHRFIISDV